MLRHLDSPVLFGTPSEVLGSPLVLASPIDCGTPRRARVFHRVVPEPLDQGLENMSQAFPGEVFGHFRAQN